MRFENALDLAESFFRLGQMFVDVAQVDNVKEVALKMAIFDHAVGHIEP